MEFKDRIKQLREQRNMSLTELGARFGKSESAARAWELGRAKPDADTLIKLAQYFDCTTDYLLGLSAARNKKQQKQSDDSIEEFLSQLRLLNPYMIQLLTNNLSSALSYIYEFCDATDCDENSMANLLAKIIFYYGDMAQASKDVCLFSEEEKKDISTSYLSFLRGYEKVTNYIQVYKNSLNTIMSEFQHDNMALEIEPSNHGEDNFS